MKKIRWHIKGGKISEFVYAPNQFAAWDTLRERPVTDFGMVMGAEPNENDDPYLCRTSILMFRWGRDEDAGRFITQMMTEEGMPDTTDDDRKAAANSLSERSLA